MGKEREASKGYRPTRSVIEFTYDHQGGGHIGTWTKAGSKQNPQLLPFNQILIKWECVNILLNPILPHKLKEVVSLMSMEAQPSHTVAEQPEAMAAGAPLIRAHTATNTHSSNGIF